jgi:type IV pilus assembly protein PilY1
MKKTVWKWLFMLGWPLGLHAQLTLTEDLTGASSTYPWQSIGGACLTAGDNTGSIPSCTSKNRIWPADPVGSGALRLTDTGGNELGAVISLVPFHSSEGVQLTFTTVTYGGSGADGIAFFLLDVSNYGDEPFPWWNWSMGPAGGPLGYSGRRSPLASGIWHGWLGIGIDEYGNFSNPEDAGPGGPGLSPNSIVVRSGAYTGYKYIVGTTVPGGISSGKVASRSAATPITFNLRLTREGLLSLSYSRNGGVASPLMINVDVTWANGPMPSKFLFGFSGSTGGSTNIHEINCFKAAGFTTSGSSAGSNVLQSAKVQIGTQLYLAYYHTDKWWGQLTAQSIVMDPVTQIVSINQVANWDASCGLTGGACDATGGTPPLQGPGSRTILTFNPDAPGGAVGIPFQWASLSAAQKTALEPGGGSVSPTLLYMRGSRADEGYSLANRRTRKSVLGDIINSSPTWVGPPQQSYSGVWQDLLYPNKVAREGNLYDSFAVANATRTNVVYVGANDGMLHGFRSGGYNALGAFDASKPNDGQELLAYMPTSSIRSLRGNVAQLDYSKQQYAHNAYVDAVPGVGDLFYGGAWHTWLVSGTGAGGNVAGVLADNTSVGAGDIFALDITNPNSFSEANAKSLVKGDWTTANLQCQGDTATSHCRDNLGNTYGTPLVRRLHNGFWAAIFGNGYNSSTGVAGIYLLNAEDGSALFLSTGAGTPAQRNGIAYVTSLDIDGDNVVDYLYAGDLLGNVWRFDVTSDTPANWRVTRVFQTLGLPISTQVLAVPVRDSTDARRIMLEFGTGRMMPQTLSTPPTPDEHNGVLVGIWDWDMSAWNLMSNSKLLSLSRSDPNVPNVANGKALDLYSLQFQTLTTNTSVVNASINGVRTISSSPVCWAGSTVCKSPRTNNQFGWRVPLLGVKEQVVYNPVLQDGLFQVSTVIPAVFQPLSCSAAPPSSGFTMALTPDEGGAPRVSYFFDALNRDKTMSNVVGVGLSAVGTPSHITAGSQRYMVTQTSNGTPTLSKVTPSKQIVVKRVTWVDLR